jgi:hypothetical protein
MLLRSENEDRVEVSSLPITANSSTIVCAVGGVVDVLPSDLEADHVPIGLSLPGRIPLYTSGVTVLRAPVPTSVVPSQIIIDSEFNVVVGGDFIRKTPHVACRVGNIMMPVIDIVSTSAGQDSSMTCAVTLSTLGPHVIEISLDGELFVPATTPVAAKLPPRELNITAQRTSCPYVGASSGFALAGYGLETLKSSLVCTIGHLNLPPAVVSDSMVVCPCPTVQVVLGKGARLVPIGSLGDDYEVSFSLGLQGSTTPLLSGIIAYYSSPLAVMYGPTYLPDGEVTAVEVGFNSTAALLDGVACRSRPVDGKESEASSLRSVTTSIDRVLCMVRCLTPNIKSLALDVSIDGVNFIEVGVVECIDAPRIVSANPKVVSDAGACFETEDSSGVRT